MRALCPSARQRAQGELVTYLWPVFADGEPEVVIAFTAEIAKIYLACDYSPPAFIFDLNKIPNVHL